MEDTRPIRLAWLGPRGAEERSHGWSEAEPVVGVARPRCRPGSSKPGVTSAFPPTADGELHPWLRSWAPLGPPDGKTYRGFVVGRLLAAASFFSARYSFSNCSSVLPIDVISSGTML